MSKEPEIISQNSSQSVLKVHEHQYGQTLLDLTFLNIDEGTIEFTTIVRIIQIWLVLLVIKDI